VGNQVTATTGGKRNATGAAATAAAVILTAGFSIIVTGIVQDDPAKAVCGACVAITALTCVALLIDRRCITDTTAERARLADATREAREERVRYVANLSALDAERTRVRRDAAAAASRQRAQLNAERERMLDEFERERERITCEAFQTGVLMERSGILTEPEPAPVAHLYPLPQRERSADTGTGVSHPS
jgi:hypothetical protein